MLYDDQINLNVEPSTFSVNTQLPFSYHHFNPRTPGPVLIFLHGFADSARYFLKRVLNADTARLEIIAPNGLFPTPQNIGGSWRPAFSWYFWDAEKQKFSIPYDFAVNAVVELCQRTEVWDRDKVLIGFSQGGYFIPFLLPRLPKIKKAIGIGAGYIRECYPETPLSFPLIGMHGRMDPVVSVEESQKQFSALKSINPNGSYQIFEKLKHDINDQLSQAVAAEILQLERAQP